MINPRKSIALICMFAGSYLFAGCDTPDPEYACNAATGVLAVDSCYNASQGLRIKPEDYIDRYNADPTLNWSVYLQMDTLNAKKESAYKISSPASKAIVIPDSVLKNSPKVIMIISSVCAGQNINSPDLSLTRRTKTGSSCTKWTK